MKRYYCKHCGGLIHAYYGGTVDIDEHGKMVESTERDKSIDVYVCYECNESSITLHNIAELKEEK